MRFAAELARWANEIATWPGHRSSAAPFDSGLRCAAKETIALPAEIARSLFIADRATFLTQRRGISGRNAAEYCTAPEKGKIILAPFLETKSSVPALCAMMFDPFHRDSRKKKSRLYLVLYTPCEE